MSVRNEIQLRATSSIIKYNYNGILLVAPRVGKSKIIIDALLESDFESITIIAPYNSILDSWRTEISKWGESLSDRIKLVNQRSLKPEHKSDILICDECHRLSENQVKNINSLNFPNILGATGTLSSSSRKTIKPLLKKTIFKYSIREAIEDRIIANYNITVVTLPLNNKDKYVESGTKKKRFFTTEEGQYSYLTKQFNKFRILAHKNPKLENIKYAYAGKRSRFIYSSKSKLELANKVIESVPGKKLIFSVLTDIADKLSNKSYHSKIHSKERELNLQEFKEGKFNKLSVCGMLSMGFTDKNLKIGIFHQLQSSEEEAQQKIMRMCNYVAEGVDAEIYILAYENTVDIDWVHKALEPFDKSKIKYESWRNF